MSIPTPTTHLAQGLANIRDHSLTVVPGVLAGDRLKATQDALYRAASSFDRILRRESITSRVTMISTVRRTPYSRHRRDALSGCSSLTFDKPRKEIRLSCR
jgi:hypothetical protein